MSNRFLFWLSVVLLVSSSGLAEVDDQPVSIDELLAGSALGLDFGQASVVSEEEVVALSSEMREFLRTHVRKGPATVGTLNQLIYAVINDGSFGLKYDETTRTAAETFRTRRGNCMSFTNMFVALARAVGIDARFQEVDVPPDWSLDNDSYVLNRHINIFTDLGVTGDHVVDFNIGDFKASYERRVISDDRALAHFYNNLGAELMQRGEVAAAFQAFTKAIDEYDRRFSPAWTNLGTLYNRSGLPSHAEAAYLKALEIDRSDLIAMSNLTTLYDRRGDQEQATRYRNRVENHRKRNPYYRFHLAREAILAEDYDLAIEHLKYAARKERGEDRICVLLGLAYLQKGDEKKSRRWMARAEELARSDSLKTFYASKIDRLKAASR